MLKMPKFCANLSFMFTESGFLERYKLAKESGFKCVESGFPFGFSKEEVVSAKNSAGIQQILVNIYTGDVTKGELGFAALPGKEQEFKESLTKTVEYAKALGAKKVHIMSGKLAGAPTKANDEVYVSNLKYAANLLEKEDLIGLIEPINKYSVPGYFMNSYEKAIGVLEQVSSPNIKLMLDVFHLQQIQGDVTHAVEKWFKHVGHVQVAQVPNRNEPNTAGEIDYKYVFQLLEKAGYEDWIGLEYKPLNDTVGGLKWIKDFNFNL